MVNDHILCGINHSAELLPNEFPDLSKRLRVPEQPNRLFTMNHVIIALYSQLLRKLNAKVGLIASLPANTKDELGAQQVKVPWDPQQRIIADRGLLYEFMWGIALFTLNPRRSGLLGSCLAFLPFDIGKVWAEIIEHEPAVLDKGVSRGEEVLINDILLDIFLIVAINISLCEDGLAHASAQYGCKIK